MRLSALYRYPLKSGRAQSLSEVSVDAIGIDGDRRWMLVDARGKMITGREHPALVLVDVHVGTDDAAFNAPGCQPLQVRCDSFDVEQACDVWKNRFVARRGNKDADQWFGAYLGIECSLLYLGSIPNRRLPAEPDIPLSFADGYPLLLIGQSSLDDLNSRLRRPVPMIAFRPNLVIEGADAYAEDRWRHMRIGEVHFEAAKPCTRCIFTTVDPQRGEKSADREPLLTLARYRRVDIGTCFGMNLIVRSGGRVRVGDTLEVLD
jgi:uncharacterized protein YcbX